MKITAEFNSNEELVSFISTFGDKSLASVTKASKKEDKPKEKILETTSKIVDEAVKELTPIVSEETQTGDIVDVEQTKITKEMVRGVFGKLIKSGKQAEAKSITEKYGASKLPDLKEEDYVAAYKDAEALL